MNISVTIDVEDYVFEFYRKVSENITHRSVQETMASALFAYAGLIAQKMQDEDVGNQQFTH